MNESKELIKTTPQKSKDNLKHVDPFSFSLFKDDESSIDLVQGLLEETSYKNFANITANYKDRFEAELPYKIKEQIKEERKQALEQMKAKGLLYSTQASFDFFNPYHRDWVAKMPAHTEILKFYHNRLGCDALDYFMLECVSSKRWECYPCTIPSDYQDLLERIDVDLKKIYIPPEYRYAREPIRLLLEGLRKRITELIKTTPQKSKDNLTHVDPFSFSWFKDDESSIDVVQGLLEETSYKNFANITANYKDRLEAELPYKIKEQIKEERKQALEQMKAKGLLYSTHALFDFFNPYHRDWVAKMPAHTEILKFYHNRLGGDALVYFMLECVSSKRWECYPCTIPSKYEDLLERIDIDLKQIYIPPEYRYAREPIRLLLEGLKKRIKELINSKPQKSKDNFEQEQDMAI